MNTYGGSCEAITKKGEGCRKSAGWHVNGFWVCGQHSFWAKRQPVKQLPEKQEEK